MAILCVLSPAGLFNDSVGFVSSGLGLQSHLESVRAHATILLRSVTWLGTARSVVGVLLGPLTGLLDGAVLVVLPVVSNSLVKRVLNVGGRHEGLDRKEHLRRQSKGFSWFSGHLQP